MKLVKLLTFTFTFIWACLGQAQAQQNGSYFFETSWGEEIRIEVSGTYSDPKFSIISSSSHDGYEIFKQYIESTLKRRNYQYVIDRPCFDCQSTLSHDGESKGDYGINRTAKKQKKFETSSFAPINKFIEAASTAAGTRAVEAIANLITTDNSDTKSSVFTIVSTKNIQGREQPYFMCKITPNSCDVLVDVNFASGSNGSWNTTYHVAVPGADQYEYFRQVEDTLNRYIRNSEYTCQIVYTGSGDNLKSQLICFPSY
jgi:hypothetical protein